MSKEQIETEARRLLEALSLYEKAVRFHEGLSFTANRGLASGRDRLRAAATDVHAAQSAVLAALSPPPTSQDDVGLCEKLREKGYSSRHRGLRNPDGPEAAARIATLSADVARMREALRIIAEPDNSAGYATMRLIACAALSGETK